MKRTLADAAPDDTMLTPWAKYEQIDPYVAGITLPKACEYTKEAMRRIGWPSDTP